MKSLPLPVSGFIRHPNGLAFAHGVADAVEHASLLVDGFGIVAMVAMTPIIALQYLASFTTENLT